MCDSVSTVPPDFDETTKNVFARSSDASSARIAVASVVSSTCSRKPPSSSPKLRRMTSGPRLDPPIPSSTASVKPSALTPATNSRRSPTCSSSSPETVSQPSRSAISGTPGPPQSDSSLAHSRRATCSSSARLARSAIGPSSASGSDDSIVCGRPVRTASRIDSTPAISLSNGSTNFSIPSRSSVSVTSVMSMPASASASSTGAGSRSAEPGSSSERSATASSVSIGIVLTVSGATSPSTYLVSG